ncbi:ABC transporter ATP-binding protein [Streptomyces sp. NPDC001835]|uniref:ABC transporter ATP-binding protein n=1 Tax=Streptomyces sp. NPDC001835 TaxID=3154528 RepID=UPI00332E25F1
MTSFPGLIRFPRPARFPWPTRSRLPPLPLTEAAGVRPRCGSRACARRTRTASPRWPASTLEIPDGAVFGLLGPNGAGKTTLIGSVCNIVRPSAGSLSVFGHDYRSRQVPRLLGLAAQEINADRFLSIRQILIHHARYHGIGRKAAARRADELLALFRLDDKPDVRAYELSGGMQRRLVLARALMHRPACSSSTSRRPASNCARRSGGS